ncbi:hypothetical protein AKJ09_06788 [Labilithrix luteola]|uniref:Uncharacterized protein n=1 Tax=Labilithrix luteola TaxID=1391654 RepID=A0A0K1Q411_9BACT|nr:hypothetical protein AKJ09_06788 [Labilithrix luteola]
MTTSRILKMRFSVVKTGRPEGYRDALTSCANDDGWVDRLPTRKEALLIAPAVGLRRRIGQDDLDRGQRWLRLQQRRAVVLYESDRRVTNDERRVQDVLVEHD